MNSTTIFFTDNSGAGFSDNVTVESEMTVEEFVREKNIDIANFAIRLNRQPATMTQVLREGDRLTVVPMKINGAS